MQAPRPPHAPVRYLLPGTHSHALAFVADTPPYVALVWSDLSMRRCYAHFTQAKIKTQKDTTGDLRQGLVLGLICFLWILLSLCSVESIVAGNLETLGCRNKKTTASFANHQEMGFRGRVLRMNGTEGQLNPTCPRATGTL